MKVYVPILIATGTLEYDLPDDTKDIHSELKKTAPTTIIIENIKPNLEGARPTPEIVRKYKEE